MESDGVAGYRRTRDAVLARLGELERELSALGVSAGLDVSDPAALRATVERLQARFTLAVVGEFSSGKSFLLNALLGKVRLEETPGGKRIAGLLATDINPSTATITELAYAPEESAVAVYPDGREERIPLDRLSRFVAVGTTDTGKLHDATADERGAPTHVRVGVDSRFLRNGFVVADTPGLASINPAHRRATLAYLPGADAVLYLIDTQTPFTEGDAAFLGIVRRSIESVFIVQTKIDLWRSPGSNGEAWENAYARIREMATRFAPGTDVFPVSAREYAEGIVTGREELVARSRFPQFLEALDATLVARTGLGRLRRAALRANDVVENASRRITALADALDRDPVTLGGERERREAAIRAIEAVESTAAGAIRARAAQTRDALAERAAAVRDELGRGIAMALDTADIARVRDRGKLHVLVDATVASVLGTFAREAAPLLAHALEEASRDALAQLTGALRADLPDLARIAESATVNLTDLAAPAFGADVGSGTWANDLESALRSTIVLGAVGGPAVSFVAAVAGAFAAAPQDRYMKRELTADLRERFLPDLDAETASFLEHFIDAAQRVFLALVERIATIVERARDAALGSIDRATALRASGEAPRVRGELDAYRVRMQSILDALDAELAAFATSAPTLDVVRAIDASTQAHVEDRAAFDQRVYEQGLRPQRWRVGILGAFKRGKSSLINAIAGERVLGDEGGSEVNFPVHVRYGGERRAFALDDRAQWSEIPYDTATDAAAQTPVLIEVPWSMPRELVLVHAPAFDSGDPYAEEIALAVAHASSEVLALFSRQLSDRELSLYRRVADLGKPISFAHTLADHESAAERRSVVELAQRYLAENGIRPERLFTVSALDYREAHAERRAAAGWNELGALISTVGGHAETHMAELDRAARDAREREALARRDVAEPAQAAESGGFAGVLNRIFGRR